MIIVVEGPTAVGKTTWSEAHARDVQVPEVRPCVDPPLGPSAPARFWTEHGASRWQEAIRIEQRSGTAVGDTDPLKLHYPWSIWRIGAADQAEFRQRAAPYRELIADQRIGFADAYLVSIPDSPTLELRRSGDGEPPPPQFSAPRSAPWPSPRMVCRARAGPPWIRPLVHSPDPGACRRYDYGSVRSRGLRRADPPTYLEQRLMRLMEDWQGRDAAELRSSATTRRGGRGR